MLDARSPLAAAAHDHSWACLPQWSQHLGRWHALEEALAQLLRLRTEAMRCTDWAAAGRLEEHIVLAEERLAIHRQRLDELADRVCGGRPHYIGTGPD
jgi:hypothetical protein